METAKLFMNGRSQAVRLPKEFRFAGDEVYIRKLGDSVILIPFLAPWDTLLESIKLFSPDFLVEREQPPVQDREDLFE